MAIGYTVMKMVVKGTANAVKKKAAVVFWKTVKKYPKGKDEIIKVIKSKIKKHPEYADDLYRIIGRVEKKFAEQAKHSVARVKNVGSQKPQNYKSAGKTFEQKDIPVEFKSQGTKFPNARNSYPQGVPFNSKGIPDFSRYIHKVPGIKSKVNVKFSGNSKTDIRLANKKAGITDKYLKDNKLTWHHSENNTMILIPRKIHEAVKHTGGDAIKRGTF